MPDESLLDLAEYISEKLEKYVTSHEFVHDELIIHAKADCIVPVLQFLRDARECNFTTLCDICGVDYFGKPLRFEIVYSLLSMRQNVRARVKISVNEGQIVPSVTDLFKSALWYEREVWDMFGVLFSGNPDLRRILTDYGFKGYPLRKDFPLMGNVELRYDEEQKRVVYEPVHLTQDYRNFDYLSPWEGMTDVQLARGKKSKNQAHGYRSQKDDILKTEEEGGELDASEETA